MRLLLVKIVRAILKSLNKRMSIVQKKFETRILQSKREAYGLFQTRARGRHQYQNSIHKSGLNHLRDFSQFIFKSANFADSSGISHTES